LKQLLFPEKQKNENEEVHILPTFGSLVGAALQASHHRCVYSIETFAAFADALSPASIDIVL
jgi:hypothetical protein